MRPLRRWTDVEDYHDGMESIDSGIMDSLFSILNEVSFDGYTSRDVRSAIDGDPSIENFMALLSPEASNHMEEMAVRAREITRMHFGNSVTVFTPLYVSNHCTNRCRYCGFNECNQIARMRLTPEQVRSEVDAIAGTGLQDILILTGESKEMSDVDYICECVSIAAESFATVGIEVYPMNTDDYARVHDAGADYVTVFQETYDPVLYAEYHAGGPKRVFSYRFDAQERALRGGMRGVALGALLGLGDPRRDAFACGVHGHLLQRRYTHAEMSYSLPRLRPYANGDMDVNAVDERMLLQVSMAYRLFMPFAGQTISTRERKGFRDGIVNISATRISAGVSVGIGEHSGTAHGDGQFEISDPRSVEQVLADLHSLGLQPVMADYVRL